MDKPKCWVKNVISVLTQLQLLLPTVHFLLHFLTQHLGLCIFDPNLSWNNPAFLPSAEMSLSHSLGSPIRITESVHLESHLNHNLYCAILLCAINIVLFAKIIQNSLLDLQLQFYSYIQYKAVSFLQVHWKPWCSQISFKRSRT